MAMKLLFKILKQGAGARRSKTSYCSAEKEAALTLPLPYFGAALRRNFTLMTCSPEYTVADIHLHSVD